MLLDGQQILKGLDQKKNLFAFLKTSALTENENELILAMGEEDENLELYDPSSPDEDVDLTA